MKQKVNELGRTMLEMIGVLAIMGLIVYGAIIGIGFGVDMYKVTATYNDIEEISQTVTDLYSWGGSYDGNIGQVLCQKGVAPLECNSEIPSRWTQSRLEINGMGNYFQIVLNKISKGACSRLSKMEYQNLCVAADGKGDPELDCDQTGDTNRLVLYSFDEDSAVLCR